MAARKKSKSKKRKASATFLVTKKGVSGRPAVEVSIVGARTLADVSRTVQKNVTRNTDVLKKLGLKACPACISGLDLSIRHRFDDVIRVDF